MKYAVKHLYIQLIIFTGLVISGPVTANEWTEGSPVGPSVRSFGQSAMIYNGAAHLFTATDQGLLWQKRTTSSWYSKNWNCVDKIKIKTAPATVEFEGKLYLFIQNHREGGKISYKIYNGSNWGQWKHTLWKTVSSPAVAVANNKMHLIWRDAYNNLRTSTFTDGNWGHDSIITGLKTYTAPAAQYFDGNIYLFVITTTGNINYKKLVDTDWNRIDGLKSKAISSVALAVSNGKLFIFAQSSGDSYYQILDRTHQHDNFLPVDEWISVESGRARTSLAAIGFQNTVYLFYGRNHSTPFLGGLPLTTAPYVFVQSSTWSDVQIAIIPIAKKDGSQCASTSDFPGLVRFADSVYNPLMIRMSLKKIYEPICDDSIWKQDKGFGDKLTVIANEAKYKGQIVVFVTNNSGGGAFSGFSINYVHHPDHVINICNSGGVNSFSPFRNSFAHEIGHYAGLLHTFRDVVMKGDGTYRVAETLAEVQAALVEANYNISTLDNDKLASWIDDFFVYDTPPDPLYEKNNVSDMKCTAVDSPVTLLDNRKTPPEKIELIPPRTNLMSYYQVSPTIINKLTKDQGVIVYQGLRRKGVITN